MNNMTGQKKSGVVVFTIILLALAGVGVFYVVNQAAGRAAERNAALSGMIRTGVVHASVTDANGRNHSVEARFAFDLDDAVDLTVSQLENASRQALNLLNYEDITGFYALSYVSREIMDNLSTQGINPDNVLGVYVTDFTINIPGRITPPPAGIAGMDRFRGLFRNAQ